MKMSVDIIRPEGNQDGSVEVRYGLLDNLEIIEGEGNVSGERFNIGSSGPCRLRVNLAEADTDPGPRKTLVLVKSETAPFAFWARDVNRKCPIVIPRYGVAVTDPDDTRSYSELAISLNEKTNREADWETAARNCRNMHCETWLGLSRDERIFAFDTFVQGNGARFGTHGNIIVEPKYHSKPVIVRGANAAYTFCAGRGISGRDNIVRRLEDGTLPILRADLQDGSVKYHITAFASPENPSSDLRGTPFLVADAHSVGVMQTPEQQAESERLQAEESVRPDTVVLCMRVEAINEAKTPKYAWFRNIFPMSGGKRQIDTKTGCVELEGQDGVICMTLMDGKPLQYDEISLLLQPGEQVCFDVFIPHSPVTREKAVELLKPSFDDRHKLCREFWRSKLTTGAEIEIPEKRIKEMISAGVLHLDLVTYGLEPDGTLAPTIGVYSPIGSESSPIIQAFDSMGWHDVARRSLQYFLDKQHEDGFIQNFGGYMLETGAALWSMGEHFRYTHDLNWVREIAPKLVKSCDYLIAWRRRNQTEEFIGRGYGLLEGKVADPEDDYHIFMLNGYAYLGLQRTAEMLEHIDPARSKAYRTEAEELKADIRNALTQAMAESPVVPLKDGTWCPSAPPWAEYRGPVALHADGGSWFTHGTVSCRDSLIGPLYLVFQEVVDPNEPIGEFLLRSHDELFCIDNMVFSQPYYGRNDYAHIRRGEVKEFLSAYYNTVAGLADRETYTFWEHNFYASPHKTHEEAWFLMQTRWMLYLEEGRTLNLLPAIPRAWMADESGITIKNAASYFGPINLRVRPSQKSIEAEFTCDTGRKPEKVVLRLPHHEGLRPKKVIGGEYDSAREAVVCDDFTGCCKVSLMF